MMGALRKGFRRLRRWIGRNETVIRWFQLSRLQGGEQEPGLVLIQIDGLSREQLERALKRRRMPFLRKLLRRHGYDIRTMYSGLPSTTPAVQGEIFYGERCAVPAFGYRDSTGTMVRMFDSGPAARVQQRLAACAEGLLAGGSAYSNIYAGGADEPHFCAATMSDWKWRPPHNPLVWASLLVWYSWSLLRISVLSVLEIILALADFLRGQIARRDLWSELKIIPSRILVSVVLRELITVGAELDATRGLPVIQLNFLGYDEQSHRRGPSSAFAHWTLKGIDDSIRRVWRAARGSERRKYSVWIYSDHGQERVMPYSQKYGRPVQDVIADIFGQTTLAAAPRDRRGRRHDAAGRAQWVRGRSKPRQPDDVVQPKGSESPGPPQVEVIALGPVGHIYPKQPLDDARREQLATALVREGHIPLVLHAGEPEHATAWTRRGKFRLPEQTGEIFGESHPFLEFLGPDLVRLCHHENAGEFVMGGWIAGVTPLSFVTEAGAHAGPGPEETRAFILAPDGAVENDRGYLRPAELRAAALALLGRTKQDSAPSQPDPAEIVQKTS